MKLLISVVMCTYNRAELLDISLDALVNQTLDNKYYEVIIIDNFSTDHTAELAKSFIIKKPNFRYVYEPEIGLSNARNRGWREANGEYVAYIDDDAKAEPEWLFEMFKFINRYPDVSVFGGPYEGYALVDIPDWFPPEYGSHNLGFTDRPIEVGKEWISGGNIVFRKEVLKLCAGFDDALGMKGNRVSYGEETRLLKDLSDQGYDVYYASKMKVKHLIAEYKMSLWWLLKSEYAVGTSSSKTFNLDFTFSSCSKSLFYNLFLFFKLFHSAEKMPFKRRLYYSLRRVFYALGAMICLLNKTVSGRFLFLIGNYSELKY
jgi:glucosyl-dolichyl phosphate glucuronosyltransferase